MPGYGTRNYNNKKVMKGGDNCHTGKHSKKVMKGAGGCATNYKVNQKGSGKCGGQNVKRGGFIRDHSPMRGASDKKKCKN